MNKYHRYIKLPFSIHAPKDDEYNYPLGSLEKKNIKTTDAYILNNYEHDKQIENFLDQFDITYVNRLVFYTSANDKLSIHIDNNTTHHSDFNNSDLLNVIHEKYDFLDNHVKLNLTFNSNEGYSTIRWWEINDFNNVKKALIEKENGMKWYEHVADEKDCKLVYECEGLQSSIVNTGQFHSTTSNGETNNRVTVSYLLKHRDINKLVYFNEIDKIFGDILYE
jgi:hypothetical protein